MVGEKETAAEAMKMNRAMHAESLPVLRGRYGRRGRQVRSRMLDEFCGQFGLQPQARHQSAARGWKSKRCQGLGFL